MMIKKSQISMEFLFLVAFVFIASFGFILAAGIQLDHFSDERNKETVEDFGNSLKTELSLASVVHDGYYREFRLPEKINDKLDYTVTVKNTTLIVSTDEYYYNSIIPNTQGHFVKGDNIIRNTGGRITIENP